jgi:hypothetical protein
MNTLEELNAAIDRLEYLALARAENANDRNDARSAAERAHAAINALQGLLESARRVERLEAALVVMSEAADQFGDWDDDDKKLFVALRLRDLRRARTALKGT